MVSPRRFPEPGTLLSRIKEAYRPIDVILNGSRARGEATPQSDLDLNAIVSDEAPECMFSPLFGWHIQEGSVSTLMSCVGLLC